MRRREVIAILGGVAVAWPLATRAQQKAMPVIGYLSSQASGSPTVATWVASFHQGLSETGYVEGKNVAIEYRWSEGHYDRLPALAGDLVGHRVDVIFTGGTPATRAAKSAAPTIPIVFVAVADPVGTGLVASLASPGGNLTGISEMATDLMSKRLELLSELVPQAGVFALLVNPVVPIAEGIIRETQAAARAKGVQLQVVKASSESEIDAAFKAVSELRADALVIGPDSFFVSRRDQLIPLSSRHAVPTIYHLREFAAAGGLISYGTNYKHAFHEAGIYAGKILNGSQPADLPVQQPTTLELVINLKTAQALGLTVPQSLLARADEVIE
jgi:putative ABC transport system substrate-binding protein